MLFDKNGRGSEELQKVTGIWYASTPFSVIRTEICFAEEAVAAIFGDVVYKAALSAYEGYEDNDFVDAFRLPVALRAIAHYMEVSGVSHEGTGRKVKMDENEKMPFEWMIDRDDRAMRDRYYRAIDSLYRFLEREKPELWEECPARKTARRCLVRSIGDFEAVFPLDGSNYAFHILADTMASVQDSVLIPFIGRDIWAEIFPELSPELTDGASILDCCKRFVVLETVKRAAELWFIDIMPSSVARRFSPSYQGNKERRAAETKEVTLFCENVSRQISDIKAQIKRLIGSSEDAQLLPENDRRNKFATVV